MTKKVLVKVFHKSKEGRELIVEQEGEDIKLLISDGYSKTGVKLGVDEARALRDALKKGIKEIDEEMIRRLNQGYAQPVMNYPQEKPYEEPRQLETYQPNESTSAFFNNEPSPSFKEESKEEFKLFNDDKPRKPKSELYY